MMRTDPLRPDMPLLALLQRATRWFQEGLADQLAHAGVAPITPAHMMVLGYLRGRDPISIAELARLAGMTRQTMHRAVKQLTQEGLVSADRGAGYPRTTHMRITDAGVRRRVIAASVLAELEAELAEHLGERTTAALRAAASRPWPDLAT
jgi:DNA-binding MarR family transcriptional regulator